MGMSDRVLIRERIIEALECCEDLHRAGRWAVGCIACPYVDGQYVEKCDLELLKDAAALLKEDVKNMDVPDKKDGEVGMSVKNGVWHNAALELPPNHEQVLIVKKLKSGVLQIGLGYCIPDYHYHDYYTDTDRVGPYWVCGGNNNVVYWMPLPKIPEA